MSEYIYESSKNRDLDSNEGIILIPDIYCLTDYSKKTAEDFAQTFRKPVFMIDPFYILSGKANNLDGEEREKAHEFMDNLDPKAFLKFLDKVLIEIRKECPGLNKFSVIGFCFGGRLAYIAGAHRDISRIISFYGGGANTQNYIEGKTPIEYLLSKKGADISVTSFFGLNDPSISKDDREKMKEVFNNADINFHAYEYPAGHAYFQEGRKNFDELASKASWEILKNIFNGH